MEFFHITNNVAGLRFVEVNGRQFAIAPMTILRSRVLQGSRGPLFYPPEENKKYQEEWNGRPLVATTHPKDKKSGANISANTPEILQQQEIGRFYNSQVDNQGTNTGEGWFDVELTKKHDMRIWNSLVNKQQIEVSTGLRNDFEELSTVQNYDGVDYQFNARNYRPDHIAILIDEKGACSIKDGCGVNNSLTANPAWVGDHSKWEKAKEQAAKEGKGSDYGYITGIYKQMGGTINQASYPESCPHCGNKLEIDPDSGVCNRCGKAVGSLITHTQTSNSMNERQNMTSWLTTNCACLKDKKGELDKLTDNAFKETILENAEKAVENDAEASFMSWISNADKDIRNAITGMLRNKFKSAMGAMKPADPNAGGNGGTGGTDPNAAAAEEMKKKQAMMQQNQTQQPTPTGNSQPVVTVEMLQQALMGIPMFKDMVTNHQTNQNNEKQQLIARITAPITDNSAKQQAVTALSNRSVEDLKFIAGFTPVAQTNNQQTNQPNIPYAQPFSNFFGASGGITDNQDNSYLQKEQLVVNNINWSEWSKDAA